METPLQRARRMLVALEEFSSQEGTLIHALDLAEAVRIGERATPLVRELCALAVHPEVASLRPRVEKLVAQRRRQAAQLGVHLARVKGELQRVNDARKQLGRVSTYAGLPTPKTRLNTAA